MHLPYNLGFILPLILFRISIFIFIFFISCFCLKWSKTAIHPSKQKYSCNEFNRCQLKRIKSFYGPYQRHKSFFRTTKVEYCFSQYNFNNKNTHYILLKKKKGKKVIQTISSMDLFYVNRIIKQFIQYELCFNEMKFSICLVWSHVIVKIISAWFFNFKVISKLNPKLKENIWHSFRKTIFFIFSLFLSLCLSLSLSL